MTHQPSQRTETVDQFLRSKLICSVGVKSSTEGKNVYVDIPSLDDPHWAMDQVRQGIAEYLRSKKDSLVIIGPDPEADTSLLEDMGKCMELLYMVIAANEQARFLSLPAIILSMVFDLPARALNIVSIMGRLRNKDFLRVLPGRWKGLTGGEYPRDIIEDLLVMDRGVSCLKDSKADEMPNIIRNIADKIRDIMNRPGMYSVDLGERKFFSLAMTPILPGHPRWAPHRMIALNDQIDVDRYSGTETGVAIGSAAMHMAEKAGYPPYNFGKFYPNFGDIKRMRWQSTSDMRSGGYAQDWARHREQLHVLTEEVNRIRGTLEKREE